jgi:hypothetical protein
MFIGCVHIFCIYIYVCFFILYMCAHTVCRLQGTEYFTGGEGEREGEGGRGREAREGERERGKEGERERKKKEI